MSKEEHIRVISSRPDQPGAYLKKLWFYRNLIKVLAVRDIKVHYAQTVLGVLWAILQPLVALLIYTIFFYKILGIDTGSIPYPAFVLPGVIIWFNFTQVISEAGTSLQYNTDLIRKIDFPKMILPLSKVLSGLVNVGISVLMLLITMQLLDVPFSWRILAFPLVLLLNIILGLSVAIWLSALTVRFRDLQHIIPYLVNFLIWITPVFYPSTILPEGYGDYVYINPLAAVVELCRWSMVGGEFPPPVAFLVFIPIVILFLAGLFFFIRTERKIADFV